MIKKLFQKRGDKYALALMIIGFFLVGYVYEDMQDMCLSSAKPKTDSTHPRFVSPFTGEFERINGVLYCQDSSGVLHKYRQSAQR